jgi:GNAT superfamily N-acetyltransferase
MKLLFDYGDAGDVPGAVVTTPIPEIDPSIAAALAARPGGMETWPDVALLGSRMSLPSGFRLRQLGRSDIPRLISALPTWFPELVGSSREGLLDASVYEEFVALAGEDVRVDHRPGYAFVIESDAEPVAFGYGEYRAPQSLLRAEIAAVAPRFRGLGLMTVIVPLFVPLGRSIGADMIIAWGTLRHRLAQRTAERSGYRLVGVVPGSDRVQLAPGVMKHVFEAVYAISLVPDEQTFGPPFTSMSPRIASVARFILGEQPDESQR